jgi:hypothetical protein
VLTLSAFFSFFQLWAVSIQLVKAEGVVTPNTANRMSRPTGGSDESCDRAVKISKCAESYTLQLR